MLVWNKNKKIEHLNPEQVQQKMDELVRDEHVIPVSRTQQLEMDQLYTIEVWFHFSSNIRVALLYKDPIHDDDYEPEPEPSIVME